MLSSACGCEGFCSAAVELRGTGAGTSWLAGVAVVTPAADFDSSTLEADTRDELLAADEIVDVTDEPAGGGGGARAFFLDDGLAELTPGVLCGLVDLCSNFGFVCRPLSVLCASACLTESPFCFTALVF